MASPNTLDTKLFSKLGQPTIQAATAFATELHEVLDIVQHREEGFSEFQERFQGLRHVLPGEHPEQVAEVMPTVKSDPLDIVVEHDARRHHQHGEAGGVGALGRETLEVDSTAAEQVDGVTVARVAERVEATEVELPDAGPAPRAARRELAFLVGEDEAELDELEHVDVALEDGVVALILVAEWAHRLQYDAGELRVHGDAGVPVDDLPDQLELVLQVRRPDLADLHVCGCLCGGRGYGHRSSRHIQELEKTSSGGATRRQGSSGDG
jgi:hypothetical protein